MSFDYGKYFGEIKLTHDLASILENATPCMAANGIDADTARGLVIKTFSGRS